MKRAPLVGLFALVGPNAFASETFLNSIPIADVLGHREVMTMFFAYGTERQIDSRITWQKGIEVGLFDRLEFGVDTDLLGTVTWNAKLQFATGNGWAMSAGVNGSPLGGPAANHYVVGRVDAGRTRFHAGVIRNDRARLMLGIDHDLGGDYSLMVDFISGPGAYAWAGLNAPVGPLYLTVSAGVPGRRADGVQFMVGFTGYFRL